MFLHNDLPIIILNDWNDYCKIDFKKEYERLKGKFPIPLEKFTMKYWVNESISSDNQVFQK
jgi:hypothetical protein